MADPILKLSLVFDTLPDKLEPPILDLIMVEHSMKLAQRLPDSSVYLVTGFTVSATSGDVLWLVFASGR
ncbi:MAG TPA: hypothetical protein VGK77_21000 [Candidatus Binatia bacterium]|jgi:hypothetical protein